MTTAYSEDKPPYNEPPPEYSFQPPNPQPDSSFNQSYPSAPGYGVPGDSPYPPPSTVYSQSQSQGGVVYPPNAYWSSYGQQPAGHPSATSVSPSSADVDIEEAAENNKNEAEQFTSFSEKSIRLGFIRKVFGLLAIMMLVTGGIVAVFVLIEDVHDFMEDNSWLMFVAIGVYLVTAFSLICVESLRRKFPHNLICLALVTLSMAVMVGTIAGYYEADEVLMAVAITFAIVLAMCILGFQTKIDFTPMIGVAMALLISLMFLGIFAATIDTDILNIVYGCLGAFIFSLLLAIDIQLIMGGKRKFQASPEEYVFCALSLYLDIIQIFLFVLMIFKGGSN